jgi:hypothetical protein
VKEVKNATKNDRVIQMKICVSDEKYRI